jgi:tetratricopeptide (TPR) repeat protein
MGRRASRSLATTVCLAVGLVGACGGAPVRTEATGAEPTTSPSLALPEGPNPDSTILELRAFAARYPGTVHAAEALARIGDLETERGRVEHAIDAYLRVVCPPEDAGADGLVVLDPSEPARCAPLISQPIPNATIWARIGHAYFGENDHARALVSFEAALALLPPEHALVPRVTYLRAWTLYRDSRYAEALEAFGRVVALPDEQLSDEALEYVALLVAEPDWDDDGSPDAERGLARPAVRTWLAAHPELEARALDGAASALLDLAELRDAIAMDDEIERRFPASPEAARALARTAEARRRLGP